MSGHQYFIRAGNYKQTASPIGMENDPESVASKQLTERDVMLWLESKNVNVTLDMVRRIAGGLK